MLILGPGPASILLSCLTLYTILQPCIIVSIGTAGQATAAFGASSVLLFISLLTLKIRKRMVTTMKNSE